METLIGLLIGCIISYGILLILDKVFLARDYKKIVKEYTDRTISYDEHGNMIYNSEISGQSFVIHKPKND